MSWEITDIMLEILAAGVQFYAIKRFIDIFLSKEECRCKHTLLLYVFACFWTCGIYRLFGSPVWNIIANLAAIFLLILPYKVKLSRKLLLTFMIYAVGGLVDSIVAILFAKYTAGVPVDQIYACITSLVILFIAIVLERTISAEKDIHLPIFYRIALGLVPVISIGCIYYVDVTATNLKMVIVIVAVSILFINILIFYLYNSLMQFYSVSIEKKMMEQMVEVYANQLDLVRESEDRVKALRHDMKHHIIELQSMLNESESQKVYSYLTDMEKFMLNPKEHVSTGNKEIDGVLNYLLQNAEQVLENMDIKISIPEGIYWKDFNVCVILGNLVDNAIRAAGKSEEKYLKLDIQTKKGILLIYIENSYSGEIAKAETKFKTSQKDFAIHGIGLENVKKIIERNGGEMKIDYRNNRFKVKVLLYLSNTLSDTK